MSTSMRDDEVGDVALDSAMRRATICCSREGSWMTTRPCGVSGQARHRAPGALHETTGSGTTTAGGSTGFTGGLCRHPGRLQCGADVGLDDPPGGAGARDRQEVHAVLAGDPARDR